MRLEALLDALVRVAEALLEAQDLLADDGEAEMPRLDGAGVHRADRDFVHAFAFDLDEGIAVPAAREARGGVEILAQRETRLGPGAVAQPLARGRRRPWRTDAEQVGRGALHAVGARKEVGDAGIARIARAASGTLSHSRPEGSASARCSA